MLLLLSREFSRMIVGLVIDEVRYPVLSLPLPFGYPDWSLMGRGSYLSSASSPKKE
jgi:hypothetical protein